MCVDAWQPATAQPSNTPAIEPRPTLTAEQVVDKLVQRNPIWRWIFIGYLQNTLNSSLRMFTFDQTLVVLERENVAILPV